VAWSRWAPCCSCSAVIGSDSHSCISSVRADEFAVNLLLQKKSLRAN
jgi:hypothetical protein